MTPKWSDCASPSYKELSSHEKGLCKSILTETVLSSTSPFGLPTGCNMCSLSAQKKDGNVYKRRKMDNDSGSLTAHEETKEMVTQSSTTSEEHLSLVSPIALPGTMILNSTAGMTSPDIDCEEPFAVLLEPKSGMDDRCMVSGMELSSIILDKKDAAECSSSSISTEPITELMSARDLCIAVLRKDGLITDSRTRITADEFTNSDANPLLACYSCGCMEHSLKMLICDSCEAAFHLSCCIPHINELLTDEWYCVSCSWKKPKGLYGKLSEGKVKPSGNTNQRPYGMSHIEYMLKDAEPYVTGARIGRDFQAQVPEWSGPASSCDNCFKGPSEFIPTELAKLNEGEMSNQDRSSIGNWIQCRETLTSGNSEKLVICGKWRRAPLYVVQSDDWDCSCCLLWDPAHADCAVPQELKTSEILKQLKYVNMLKNRLVSQNQKPG